VAAWKAYLLLLPIFAVIDLTYLGFLMTWFYSEELGTLARRSGESLSPRWIPALIVYLLIPAGIILFVRPQLTAGDPLTKAILWGALYGLVVYGVYDFTNRATLEKYSLRLTLADTAWGIVLCSVSTALLHWLAPNGR
jgi:uncharacterized membrane protein